MNRLLTLGVVWLGLGTAAQAQTQATAREPVAVKASFDQTWTAVEKVVRGDLINDRLNLVEETAGYRRGRWYLRIPPQDFRAASWASCQSGAESPVAPRSGVVEVVVRGDTAAATVTVTVNWSAQNPSGLQTATVCRSFGEYEKDAEKNIRKNAERAARR